MLFEYLANSVTMINQKYGIGKSKEKLEKFLKMLLDVLKIDKNTSNHTMLKKKKKKS